MVDRRPRRRRRARSIDRRSSEISAYTRICAGALALVVFLLGAQALAADGALAGPCDPPANEIVCENSKPGNPPSEWDVEGAGDPSIQGFATDIGVDRGETVHFKVDTDSDEYHLDVYRMGYYGGDGARRVDTVEPSVALPQKQPDCDTAPATGLVDCGNWAESASWAVPAEAVSGIYFAKLVRDDEPASDGSHILFVVRDDGGDSDLLFQTSDTTWEAYNRYGGNSLYAGGPGTNPGRAYEVSYNRPLTTRGTTPEDAPFAAEYPLVRWLERNGYDVSYFTGVDADRRGGEILDHEAYLSVGHDEYWSGPQRASVEAARDAGVDLAFFSGNEIFWKTRWEDSIDGSGTDHRTLVSYKETHANAKIDPEADVWTGTWRDPRFSPPADGGKPENSLSGTIFMVDEGTAAIQVPAADGRLRLWRDTGLASLGPGETATLGEDTLGYEWDEDVDNGFRPPGLMDLSSTTVEVPQRLVDHGSNYAPGTGTHHLTLYRAPSGALVFGAGTVQWSWGLDGEHDRGNTKPDSRMQQATVNLLADMGVKAGSLQEGLLAATQTTDTDPPTTTIGSPGEGAQLESGEAVTIGGTATDASGETAGGQVAGVEVSTDGGQRWHPANGRDQWTYAWTPGAVGKVTIEVRAVDDSGNLETPGDQVGVEVTPPTCPCSIWDESLTAPEDDDPAGAVELGVKFRSDVAGVITGIRFYKTAGNLGQHVGRLWTAAGTQLAQAAFTGESPSGWQTVTFDQPVSIEAGKTYVASYHAPNGNYAALSDYFALVGHDNGPLHALADGVDGENGVFQYGSSGGLFAEGAPRSFHSTNYLVDVVFNEQVGPDTTPPSLNGQVPGNGAAEIGVNVAAGATFSEAMNPATISPSTVELRDGSGGLVERTVSYSPGERRATVKSIGPLHYATAYTVTVKGGASGVKDLAGNPLPSSSSWSFTTEAPPPPPPDSGPGGPILVISSATNPFSRYYGEILRAEGLNEFTVKDISTVTAATLDAYDVTILGEVSLSSGQVQMLESWVSGGGNLIAMRPDPQLAGLLGLSPNAGALANAYLKVDTGTAPGAGIVNQTIQFHGSADRYTPTSAQTIATLYSNASSATANPAVTLRSVGGKGGQAASFSYDLARSVVLTRQGNPAWSGEERDGGSPIRSDDLFFGNKAGDSQPDWVDLEKVAIPQADEQQRLLTNLIEGMNADRKPLPRFWFLPRDERAAVVMTGDDHGNGGTAGRFDEYEKASPPGCVVAKWECVRSTSYIYPGTPLTDAQASAYSSAGFELSLHTLTNCGDWDTQGELNSFFSSQLAEFFASFPSLPAPATNRTHCVAWGDWATQPKVERENGIRLDTNYYYWPASWVQDRPGVFTGSGMPMRFADLDGSLVDVYQVATQMTDESEQSYPFTVDTLLDNALGSKAYYGVFGANMHTDVAETEDSDAIVASAQAHGVPVVSARQMLTWLDGRNQSSFGAIGWTGNRLTFTINPGEGANGLRAMLPVSPAAGDLLSIKRGGAPVATAIQTIKGIEYAFFDATAGSYTAVYGPDLTATTPASPANANSLKVTGSAPSGSTVRIYATTDCSGPPLATGSAAQLAGGISVSVADDTATEFRATATLANGSVSPCSAPLSYVEDSSAPVTQIDSHPTNPVASTAASFAFSGADGSGSGVASFQCRRDSEAVGAWQACTSPQSYAGLGQGSHKFEVRAIDGAGNVDPTPAVFNWTVDTVAPQTQIDLGPPALSVTGDAEFKFSGADSTGSGVASFECRLDSAEASAWGACASPQAHASLGDGSHKFEVRAIDGAGNVDQSPASLGWNIDVTQPDTQIGKHPNALIASSAAQLEFSGSDGSGSGVASFQCRLDSAEASAWGACGSPQSYSSLADGSHKFEARAIDVAGNVDQSPASLSWTVDTTAPQTQIDSGPPSLSASSNAELEFSGSDGSGSGVASFQCRLDSSEASAWGPCPSPKEYAALADGAHKFEVRAIDVAGNVDSTPASLGWTIDTTAPDTQIDGHPAALVATPSAQFEFSGSDGSGSDVVSFQCRLDSTQAADWTLCKSPKSYGGLADGAHRLEVRAIDQAGNVDATPASFEWNVDITAPQTQVDSGPTALSALASAKFTFSGSDGAGSGVASFECRRDTGEPSGWAPCASPFEYASLGDGGHKFEVRAVDVAGNVDQSPAVLNWTIDTAAPDTQIDEHPTALSATSSAQFKFSGSDGSGSGVASFQCRRDSSEASAWASCSSPQSYVSLGDGSHELEVRAIDQAGNVDAAPASFEWSVDTAAPDTQIEIAPPALSASAKAKLTFSGSDGAGSGVASFQCRLDSSEASAWQACPSPKEYAALSDGSHKFEVRAIDTAGNVDSSPAAFNWSVDTMAPGSQVDTHPPLLSGSAEAKFTFSGSDAGGSGLASFQCRLDSSEAAAWGACTSPKTYAVLSDGPHKLEVRAIDVAGNVDPSPASFEWSIDTTAPDTQIDDHPKALEGSAASFSFSGLDGTGSGVASFQCRIDSSQPADWGACSSPKSYSSLADGTHRFEVRVVDVAGNVDPSPAGFEWVVDTTPPQTQIDTGPLALSGSASAKFIFSGSDGAGSGIASFECRLDSTAPSGWQPCSSPREYAALSDGAHKLEVRSIDGAANVDQSPAMSDWTIDTTPPAVTVDSLSRTLLGIGQTSEVHWHANENGAFELRVGGSDCATGAVLDSGAYGSQPAVHTSIVAVADLAEGQNTLRLCLTDAASNRGSTTATLSRDTTTPETQIDGHPNSLSASASASFSFSGSDGAGSGVASFECRRDSSEASAWAPCASPQAYASLTDGAHAFQVHAVDVAGNPDPSPATFGWTVDTTPPTVTIDSGPSGLTNDSTPTFAFHAGEAGSSFECSIDTGTPSFGPCSDPGSHTPASPLSDGAHTLRVRAIDAAANQGAATTREFTVDTAAPPAPELTSTAPASPANENSPKIVGSAPGGSTVRLYASLDCSGSVLATVSAAQLADGILVSVLDDTTTKFSAIATSPAGNASGCSAPLTYVEDSSAPNAKIDGQPASPASSALATFVFSGSDGSGSGIASFQCRIDSSQAADWEACSSPRSYSSLGDGAHSFEVRAIDQAGNVDLSPASFNWSIDTAAPQTQIDSHPPALTTTTSAQFGFSGSDGSGSGVATFQCRIDSVGASAWESCSSLKTYASLVDGAHGFEVRAIDAAGNIDASPANFGWTVDTTGPQTQIDAHPSSLNPSTAAQFEFSATDSGGSGASSFECRRDSTEAADWGACSSPKSYSLLADSSHKFEVRAIDVAGNVDSTPAVFTWTVDTTAPQTQIDSHPAALSASASAQFGFSGTDSSGAASFECRRDSTEPSAWETCASPKAYASLADGTHRFEVRTIDAVGNIDPSPASFEWSVDTTAPETQINSHPSSLSASASASFAFSGSDGSGSGVASFECRRDSSEASAWAPCSSSKDYASLTDGAHVFQVRAVDVAGNPDPSPATFGWTVDTTPPTVTIDSGPSGLTNDSMPTFAFHASEAGSSFECSIDTGTPSFGPCSDAGSHTPASPLSDGAHTLRVRATDAAANQGAATTREFTIDTAAPPAPALTSTAPASPANENSPKIAGSAPAGSAVRLYASLDCSGSVLATVSAAQLADGVTVSVPDDTTTRFSATATSPAGNVSGCSDPIAYIEDSSAPDAQIDGHPANPANSALATFVFSGSDGSGSGVASFQCRIDSSQAADWEGCSSPKSYSSLGEGSHSFEVRAIDQAGNIDPSPASFTWTVDTAAPQTQIVSHPPALTTATSAQFGFSGSDGSGSGVASFQCRLDSAEASAWEPCSSPKTYASLADGAHGFEVRAIDTAGNIDASPANFGWTVDTTAPAAPELTGTVPGSPANENSPKIAGSAPTGSTVRLYANVDCSGAPIGIASDAELANGVAVSVPDDSTSHFSADAIASGKPSPCSLPLTYVEDSTAPSTQIDAHPDALSDSATAQFEFSGSDGSGSGVASFECRRDSESPIAWQPCNSPRSYASLADGPHAFQVRAIDGADNADESPAVFSWTIDTATPPVQTTVNAVTPEPPSTVHDVVRILQIKYDRRRRAAILTIEVPGPGRLSAASPEPPASSGLRKAKGAAVRQRAAHQIVPKSVRVAKAGKVKLPVKLTQAGRQLLLEDHKVTMRVQISFESVDGTSESRTIAITLKQSLPRKR